MGKQMLDPFPRSPDNRSMIGRLLEEISWGDIPLSRLRTGGRGFENVLTTQVFQAIDFLPRRPFFATLLDHCHGAPAACARLAEEAEDAEITVLPSNAYLRPSRNSHSRAEAVQPDVLVRSHSVFGIVEAKGMRKGLCVSARTARPRVLSSTAGCR